jgi:putative ABC transport system ATP-binding protein
MSVEDNFQNGPVIHTVDLWRTYRAGTHQEVHALQGVDLDIESGSYFALKGRSGSGKTTLLNLIGGLDRPTKG